MIAWKGSLFNGTKIFSNEYYLSVEFVSAHNGARWILTGVYGPSASDDKLAFINWLKDIQMPQDVDWMILGDFNLIRRQEDRNRPGDSLSEILLFNDSISSLGLNEIMLQGRKYTWSNMQPSPLLEKLDWVFTSSSWTLSYLNISAKALDMLLSDHTPFVVIVSTNIPRSSIFRFENHWLCSDEFNTIVSDCWHNTAQLADSVRALTAKFKSLRKRLREWQSTKSGLRVSITNSRITMLFLDNIGDYRDLCIEERNFKEALKAHLLNLLE